MFLRSLFLLCCAASVAFSAPRFSIVHPAPRANYSIFVEGLDGAVYGCFDGQSIFRLSRSGDYRVIYRGDHHFYSSLIAAPDGNLYGTSQNIVFRLSYRGEFDVLHQFSNDDRDPEGRIPASLVLAADGNIYGVTFYGGQDGRGTLFRITLEGQFSKVADFPAPFATILSITPAADGALWGISTNGTNEPRQIFRATLDGTITDPIVQGSLPGPIGKLFAHPSGDLYTLGYQSFGSGKGVLLRVTTQGSVSEVRRYDGPPYFAGYRATLGNDNLLYYGAPDFETRADSQQIMRVNLASGERTKLIGPVNGSLYRLEEATPLITHDGWLYTASSGPNFENGVIARLRLPDYPEANLCPLARPDFIRPPKAGQSTWIPLLANDSDANGDPISLRDVGTPRHGSIEVDPVRGRVRYTPPAEPVLEDTFTYRIADANGAIGIGRVVVRADIRGRFSDLFTSAVGQQDGRIDVTLGRSGAISGRLWLGGISRKFLGHLDESNRFEHAFPDFFPIHRSATLSLSLEMDGKQPIMSARVNGVNLQFAEFSISAELSRPNPHLAETRAGAYTFALPSNPGWKSQPSRITNQYGTYANRAATAMGDGFGMIRLSKSGIATAVGKMPDGAPFSSSQALDRAGQLLFYAPLYFDPRTAPSVLGWLRGSVTLGDAAESSDVSGDLRWVLPQGYYYGDEFLKNSIALVGSRYVPSANLQGMLNFAPRFRADDNGGFPAFAASTWINQNSLLGVLPSRINGRFTPSSGLLAGHFSPPGKPHWIGYQGILLQKQQRIVGQYLPLSKRGTARFDVTRP